MKWEKLLQMVGEEPVFSSALFRIGKTSSADVHLQLSRWVQAGRLNQLRRGVYTLAPPYAKKRPHPFLVAQFLRSNSYVSLQSALSYHGIIPEHVPVVTSVTTGRPESRDTPLGSFLFRHIGVKLFTGYRQVEIFQGQRVFLASPEKALLDLIHLTAGGDSMAYLEELRLQNWENLDLNVLAEFAHTSGKPKLLRAWEQVCLLAEREVSP